MASGASALSITKCWICGDSANSREHMMKASDIKSVFGKPSQKYPIFFNSSVAKNIHVYGLKSDILKYPANLCSNCNNQRTQTHDIAWERLSVALRSSYSPIKPGVKVRLNRIFPYDTTAKMRNVQLYFTKQLGCRIAAESMPIDMATFSKAILENRHHQNIFLTFGCAAWAGNKRLTGMSEVHGQVLSGRCVAAAFFYHVNDLAVSIAYLENTNGRSAFPNSWNPAFNRNRIIFNNFLAHDGAP